MSCFELGAHSGDRDDLRPVREEGDGGGTNEEERRRKRRKRKSGTEAKADSTAAAVPAADDFFPRKVVSKARASVVGAGCVSGSVEWAGGE